MIHVLYFNSLKQNMPTSECLIALLLLLLKPHWVFKALLRFSGNTFLREALGLQRSWMSYWKPAFPPLPKVSIDQGCAEQTSDPFCFHYWKKRKKKTTPQERKYKRNPKTTQNLLIFSPQKDFFFFVNVT